MKSFKRLLAVFMCVVLTLSAAPLGGFVGLELPSLFDLKAEAATYSGTCGDNLTWSFDGDTGVLSITGTGAMYDYSGLVSENPPWRPQRPNIKSVEIGNGVTTIGNYAFANCYDLTNVTIPGSVISIGSSAFDYCSSLAGVTIPYGVITIGDYAFTDCQKIPNLTLPDSVTTIGKSAFQNCSSLVSVTIPHSVISIGDYPFSGCYELTGIVVDSDNEYYSSDDHSALFDKNKTVLICYPAGNTATSYVIPDSVTTIGGYAFSNCDITSITIPDGVTAINSETFSYCYNLTSVIIPDGVTSIGYKAFFYCYNLTSVTIPDSVTSIGYQAFYGCSKLSSATIGNGVKSIGYGAFYGCRNLTNLTIGNSLTTVDNYAFQSCDAISNVYYTGDVAKWCAIEFGINRSNPIMRAKRFYIGGLLLQGELVIPDGVTSIGAYAFYGCDGITGVTCSDSVTSIGDYAFFDCDGITSVTVSDSVTSIGAYAFYGCDGIANVTIPDSVTSIGENVFRNCTKLANVKIGKGLTSISKNAFSDCTGLTEVTLSDAVTKMEEDAFYNCKNVTTTYYGGTPDQWKKVWIAMNDGSLSNSNIVYECDSERPYYYGTFGDNFTWKLYTDGELAVSGTGAMMNWSSYSAVPWYKYRSLIKSLTVSDAVTSIGNYALYDCDNLVSVTVSSSITSIGAYAFYSCDNLENVTIGYGVSSIADGAFGLCNNLTDVYYRFSEDKWNKISIGSENEQLTSATIHCFEAGSIIASGKCGENLTWTFYENGLLEIIGTGCMTNWSSSLPAPWYEYRSLISLVIFSDGVTSIGDYALYSCSNLELVTINNSVTSIGKSAFGLCSSIKNITIPDGVITVGDFAFDSCSNLINIKIGKNVTSIGDGVLLHCDKLLSIIVDENNMFYSSDDGGALLDKEKSRLIQYPAGNARTSYTVPVTVMFIGDCAFRDCRNLTSVNISGTVKSIGDYAFYNCDVLSDVYYSSTQANWNDISIASNNVSLTDAQIHFGEDEPVIHSGKCGDNVNWTLYESGLLEITGTGAMTNYTSSSDVPWKFYRSDIETVDIGSGVTTISDYAFGDCYRLTNVTIGNSVTTIGVGAFDYCRSLECIIIPESVTTICAGAFVFEEDMKDFSLTHVYYTGSLANWCAIKFENSFSNPNRCANNFYINGVPVKGALEIPDGVTSIGDFAFYGCNNITSVSIPYSVKSIGRSAFYLCENITNVTIPESVTNIGAYAFSYCKNITGITIPESVTSIGGCAFYSCDMIESITIPGSVKTIASSAFSDCDNLVSVTIQDGVTAIASSAFAYCDSLKTLTIPESLTNVGEDAFYCCDRINAAYYPGTPEQWGNVEVVGANYTNGYFTRNIVYECNSERPYYTGSCGAKINWKLYTDGELIISGKGTMNSWNGYKNAGWYNHRSIIKSATISDGITNIGNHAFYSCSNLEKITIGKDIAKISTTAFHICKSLTDVYYASTEENWNKINIDYSYNDALLNATIHYHEHKHTSTITTSATCTDPGVRTYICDCGDNYTETIDATGHSHESKVTKEPTCEDDGVTTFTCHCGDSYTEVIKANGHTKGEWEYIGGMEYAKSCTVCGDKLESKIVTVDMFFNGENVNKRQVLNKSAATVTATVTDNFVNNLVFASSDNSTVSVDANGNVVANNIGKATITVTIKGTAISDSIEVEVLPRDFTVTWNVNGKQTNQTVKEEAEFTPNVNTTLKGYKFIGWNKTVPTTMPAENLTFTAQYELIVKQLKIKNPSTSTINYGETLVMHADFGGVELPEGWKIQWTVEGAGFDMAPAADGLTCKMTSVANGNATVKATLVDENGEAVLDADGNEMSDSKQLTSKAGFWQKFISFFKNLFGISRVILQSI